MVMTVLFHPPNLNMAVCLFGLLLRLKSVIWGGVVAMQQVVA
jgi:hypothetical protein